MQKRLRLSEVVFREDLYPRITPNPAQIQQYAENLEVFIENDTLVFKSNNVAIGIQKSNKFLCVNEWQKAVFEKWLNIGFKKTKTEKDLQYEIAKKLSNRYNVETEKYVLNSRIDILATNENETLIIETKQKADSNTICHAVGQLLFYKTFYPDAKLFIATIEKINDNLLNFITSNNIKTWND